MRCSSASQAAPPRVVVASTRPRPARPRVQQLEHLLPVFAREFAGHLVGEAGSPHRANHGRSPWLLLAADTPRRAGRLRGETQPVQRLPRRPPGLAGASPRASRTTWRSRRVRIAAARCLRYEHHALATAWSRRAATRRRGHVPEPGAGDRPCGQQRGLSGTEGPVTAAPDGLHDGGYRRSTARRGHIDSHPFHTRLFMPTSLADARSSRAAA